jgi:predicted NBD/HSP70 family sugar kinase
MPSQPSSVRRRGSNKRPRRINSNAVLTIVRKRQPISRVDLARYSGLLPSTVSLVVEELITAGWLVEGEAVKGAMGRRPRLLSLANTRAVLSLDIHPRRTTLGVVDVSGNILHQAAVTLSSDSTAALRELIATVKQMLRAYQHLHFEGIGICLPGRTDPTARELVFAPNLRWPIVALKSRIEKATSLPVHMDNVANACALLEVWRMPTEELHDLVVVEVSEGIGTGLFINGAIARGRGGMAGEFGHIQMEPNGHPCNCGGRGCWETLASHGAALRYYRERVPAARNLTFARLLDLAAARDSHALAALEEAARAIGRGLQMVAAALAPQEIVIVGDITAAWEHIGTTIEHELVSHPLARNIRLRPSYEGTSARLRSGVVLVLHEEMTSV